MLHDLKEEFHKKREEAKGSREWMKYFAGKCVQAHNDTTKKRHIRDILSQTNFFLSYLWHFYDDNCDKTWYHHRCGGLLLLWQKIMTENGLFVLGGPETQLHDILWVIHDGKNRGRSEGEENIGVFPVTMGGRGRERHVSLVHARAWVRGVGL